MVTPRAPRPLVVGLGGTGRPSSSTERALIEALYGAEQAGADTRVFGGTFLAGLPLYRPQHRERSRQAAEFLDALARADGVIVATPSYHGGVSGMIKNALDYLEDMRTDPRPYLDGRAVGCVVTAAGWQAGGLTLSALRSIVHALRAWPTPLGVTLNTTESLDGLTGQLHTVGRQVVEFAMAFGGAWPAVDTGLRSELGAPL